MGMSPNPSLDWTKLSEVGKVVPHGVTKTRHILRLPGPETRHHLGGKYYTQKGRRHRLMETHALFGPPSNDQLFSEVTRRWFIPDSVGMIDCQGPFLQMRRTERNRRTTALLQKIKLSLSKISTSFVRLLLHGVESKRQHPNLITFPDPTLKPRRCRSGLSDGLSYYMLLDRFSIGVPFSYNFRQSQATPHFSYTSNPQAARHCNASAQLGGHYLFTYQGSQGRGQEACAD